MNKLTAIEREAYYVVYNKKCRYCENQILYKNLEIDHIIPISLKKKPEELKNILREIQKTYKLPNNFSLEHRMNLIPTCKKCNSGKGDNVDIDRIVHFLSTAKNKDQKFLTERKKINKSQSFDKALMYASSQIFSFEQLERFTSELCSIIAKSSISKLELENPLSFKNDQKKLINTEEIEDLLNLELELQSVELTLTNDAGNIKKVKTCNEWKEATEENYYALSNYDIKEESCFKIASQVIKYAKKAQVPSKSYITDSKLGITDIKFLSLDFLPEEFGGFGLCDEYLLKNKHKGVTNIQELVALGELRIADITRNSIRLEDSGGGICYRELLRADLNNDKLEDILIFWYVYSIRGSFGFGDTAVISRKAVNSPFVFL